MKTDRNLKRKKLFHRVFLSKTVASLLLTMVCSGIGIAQTLPYTFTNKSTFADNAIYVAVVGIVNNAHVWLDCKTSTVKPKISRDNRPTA